MIHEFNYNLPYGIERSQYKVKTSTGPQKKQINDKMCNMTILNYGLGSGGFDVKLQGSNISYILQFQKPFVDRIIVSETKNRRLSISKIYAILQEVLGDQSSSSTEDPSVEYYFDDTFKSGRSIFKEGESNETKRRCVSRDYNDFLHMKIILQGNNKHIKSLKLKTKSHLRIHLTFLTVPSLPLYHLPDEIFVDIFKFLTNKFLLTNANYVTKRFHNIVYSEYMFKIYFSRYFPNETRVDETKSFKYNTIQMYQKVPRWVPTIDTDETNECFKKLILERKYFDERYPLCAFTSEFVSKDETHEWVVRIQYFGEKDDEKQNFYGKRTVIGVTSTKSFETPKLLERWNREGGSLQLSGTGGSVNAGGGGFGWGGGNTMTKVYKPKEFKVILCSSVFHIEYERDGYDTFNFFSPNSEIIIGNEEKNEQKLDRHSHKLDENYEEQGMLYCCYVMPDKSFQKVVLELVSFKKLDQKVANINPIIGF